MYVKFLVLAPGQIKAIAGTVVMTRTMRLERWLKLTPLGEILSFSKIKDVFDFAQPAGKQRTDELKIGKRRL